MIIIIALILSVHITTRLNVIQHNTTYCCVSEFNKLNTTFGPGRCIRFEKNDSYVSFGCKFSGTSSNTEYNKLVTGLVSAGVIVGLVVIVVTIISCVVRGTRGIQSYLNKKKKFFKIINFFKFIKLVYTIDKIRFYHNASNPFQE